MEQQKSQLYLWEGAALFIGTLGGNDLHRHPAVQVCIGLDGGLDIYLDGHWHQARFVVIPANIPHSLSVAAGRRLAVMLIYGSTPLARQFSGAGPVFGPRIPAGLDVLPDSLGGARRYLDRVAESCLGSCRPASRRTMADARVLASLEHIEKHIGQTLSAAHLARHVRLSEGRFLHLFSQQMGLPLRRYVLWRRIILTVDAVKSGLDLTTAAQRGGFADSAHFSRTFRQTFGLTPSEMLKSSRNVQVFT